MNNPFRGELVVRPTQTDAVFVIHRDEPVTLPTAPRHSVRWTLLIVASLVWFVPVSAHAASYSDADIIAATNAERAGHYLPTLHDDVRLSAAAADKAADMFSGQYFDHVSPTGLAPWAWFADEGYDFTAAGENLAVDFADGKKVVEAWMASADHRRNILNPQYRDIGVAVVNGIMDGKTTTVVVQFFGRRESLAAAPVVVQQLSPPQTVAPSASLLPALQPTAMPTPPLPLTAESLAAAVKLRQSPPLAGAPSLGYGAERNPPPAEVSYGGQAASVPPAGGTGARVKPVDFRTEPAPALNTEWQPTAAAPQVAGLAVASQAIPTTIVMNPEALDALPSMVMATLGLYLVTLVGAAAFWRFANPTFPLSAIMPSG